MKKQLTASIRIRLLMSLLAAFAGTNVAYSQEKALEYRGVSNAELQDQYGHTKKGEKAGIIEMGDRLIVEVSNLDGWLYDFVRTGNFPKQAWFDTATTKLIAETDLGTLYQKTALATDDPKRPLYVQARESVEKMLSDVQQRLYLQLGPARLRHLNSEDPLTKQSDNGIFHFVFPIHDTPEDRAEWNKLRSTHGQLRPVSVSLAFDLEGLTHTLRTKLGSAIDSAAEIKPNQQFYFQVYSPFDASVFAIIYLVCGIVFLCFAGAPNLLRDPDGPIRDGRHVFSLSRCQLAWWFFIILAAWIFLSVTTSSRGTLNTTALIVAGIGSGTAISGALAGKVKESVTNSSLANLSLTTNDRPSGFRRGPGAFLYDLLADKDTVGFHRFQLLIWNVVLGVVFLSQTWSEFAMPEFNSTLLGLLGLSSATFVGLKMTPNQ